MCRHEDRAKSLRTFAEPNFWRPYMRITWRGLELPTRVERDKEVSTSNYGRFYIEPFERGFGTTIGNSLRRVLLSSLGRQCGYIDKDTRC